MAIITANNPTLGIALNYFPDMRITRHEEYIVCLGFEFHFRSTSALTNQAVSVAT